MGRAFLIVLDSAGAGGAPDAAAFGDEGSNTLGHIAQACAEGRADQDRKGPLHMPHLDRLGLGAAVELASGLRMPNFDATPQGLWGAATEISMGKDTPSGHWEIAGVPVPWDWHTFPNDNPAFPPEVMAALMQAAGTDGLLSCTYASGTQVINDFGAEHIKTGYPICYTSVDSVLQIAAHEVHFGLDRLLDLCKSVAPMLHDMKVGRVIARPFLGETTAGFARTSNRKDFAIETPAPTLCDWVTDAGGTVHAIGKIGDIFSMRGISHVQKGPDAQLMEHLIAATQTAADGDFVFANFVEFDTLYGHRRDVAGYARALEWFDAQMPRIMAAIRPDDLIIFTADHGNDPTWVGTDHTRERVPVVGKLSHTSGPKAVGHVGFADIGASIAAHLGLKDRGAGDSFL